MIERRDLIMGKRGERGLFVCLFVCLEHYNQKGVLNAVYLFIKSNSGVFRRAKLELDRSNISTMIIIISFVVRLFFHFLPPSQKFKGVHVLPIT